MLLKDTLLKEVKKVIEPMNIMLVELRSKETRSGLNINIVIEKEGGVTLDDCERVTRLLNDRLAILQDQELENYRLQVSSPGLSRTFKSRREYEIFKLRPVIIYTNTAFLEGKTVFEGILEGMDGDRVKLKTGSGKLIEIPYKSIKKTKLNG